MKRFYGKQSVYLLSGMIAVLFALSFLAYGVNSPEPAHAEENATVENTITVTGRGELSVVPDVAYVHLGVQTNASTAKAAQENNAKAFAAIEKVLYEQYKLDKKDVKTMEFNVYPEYSYDEKRRTSQIVGYNATQMVQVTFRDLKNLGTFVDDVTEAGANRLNGIQFGTEKEEAYELQAIEKAMANAKAKAETIAKTSGKTLKGVIAVSEAGATPPVVLRRLPAMDASAAAEAKKEIVSSISPGEIKLSASVTVTYSF